MEELEYVSTGMHRTRRTVTFAVPIDKSTDEDAHMLYLSASALKGEIKPVELEDALRFTIYAGLTVMEKAKVQKTIYDLAGGVKDWARLRGESEAAAASVRSVLTPEILEDMGFVDVEAVQAAKKSVEFDAAMEKSFNDYDGDDKWLWSETNAFIDHVTWLAEWTVRLIKPREWRDLPDREVKDEISIPIWMAYQAATEHVNRGNVPSSAS